jgi:hypothetical protein
MKFDFLKQLLKEAPFDPHAHDLAMGDESQDGAPGTFTSNIMGLTAEVSFNEDCEVTDVELGDEVQYDRDLLYDLNMFAQNGGLGYCEPEINYRDGLTGLSYQRAHKHNATITVSGFESAKGSLVDTTETTSRLWDAFTEENNVIMTMPTVGDNDQNILLLVPVGEDNGRYSCDLYFDALGGEGSGDFLDMVLYSDKDGVVNNSLSHNGSNLAGKVTIRDVYNTSNIRL